MTSVDKYNHYVVAQGRVSDTQNAFSVQVSRVNFKGQVHRVSNASATIPGTVGELVLGVTGLSDFVPRPAVERRHNLATGKPIAPKPFFMADLVANSTLQKTCMAGPEQVTFTTPGGGPSATYRGQIYVPDPANLDYCPGYIPAQLQTAYGLNSLLQQGMGRHRADHHHRRCVGIRYYRTGRQHIFGRLWSAAFNLIQFSDLLIQEATPSAARNASMEPGISKLLSMSNGLTRWLRAPI